jgi:hypothetical protein
MRQIPGAKRAANRVDQISIVPHLKDGAGITHAISRRIEHDVVNYNRLRCLGLEKPSALLFVKANFTDDIVFHTRKLRMISVTVYATALSVHDKQ